MGTHDRLLVLLETEEIWDPEDSVFLSGRFITSLQLMHTHLFFRIEGERIGRPFS